MRRVVAYPITSIGVVLCLVIVVGACLRLGWRRMTVGAEHCRAVAGAFGGFPVGTDAYGRMCCRGFCGGRGSGLVVAVASIAAAILVGGGDRDGERVCGGAVDLLVMQAMDVLLSFPSLILGLIVVALLGPDLWNLVFAIALTAVAPFARIARAPVLSLKERAYVEAGRSLGFSHARILFVHILPNIVSEVLVMGSLWMATAVRTEASLSFIGLGVSPPTPTWGGDDAGRV